LDALAAFVIVCRAECEIGRCDYPVTARDIFVTARNVHALVVTNSMGTPTGSSRPAFIRSACGIRSGFFSSCWNQLEKRSTVVFCLPDASQSPLSGAQPIPPFNIPRMYSIRPDAPHASASREKDKDATQCTRSLSAAACGAEGP